MNETRQSLLLRTQTGEENSRGVRGLVSRLPHFHLKTAAKVGHEFWKKSARAPGS
jgi:hypothetical protein